MNLGERPALIVIDMQNGFCSPDGFMARIGLAYEPSAEVIGPISRLRASARKAEIPIYFTRYSLNEDYSDGGLLMEFFPAIDGTGGLVRGSWDAAVVEELTPADGEVVLDKTRYSAFYDTDLEERLAAEGVDSLIVCGVTTNICVESTVRDAFFRDIRPIVPEDGTAAVTPELHEGALEDFRYGFGQVVSIAEIEAALEQTATSSA